MIITPDASSTSGYLDGLHSASWSHVCAKDALLIVSVAINGAAVSDHATSVTANGVGLTKLTGKNSSGGYAIELWATDPSSLLPAGSYTIAVAVTGGTDLACIAQSMAGTVIPPLVSASVADADTVNVTADDVGAIVAAICTDDGSVTTGSGTIQQNLSGRFGSSTLSTQPVAAPGSITANFGGVAGGATKSTAAVFIRSKASTGKASRMLLLGV